MMSEPRQGCGNQRRNVAGLGVAVLLAVVPACGAAPPDADSIPVQPSGDPNDPRLFQQSIYITDSLTDLALEGPGFLPVRTGPAVRYVRGGRFTFDDIGYLTDDRGRVLQVAPAHGVSYDLTGDVSTSGYWASCESTKRLAFEGNQTIEINFGPATDAGSNSKGMTMQPAPAVITKIEADGGCVVDDLEVSHDGVLSAQGASRLRRDIGRIPVVIFDHPEGLYELEPGLYATTLASGPARFGAQETQGRGRLLPGALESGVSACDQMRPDSSEPLCGSPRKVD